MTEDVQMFQDLPAPKIRDPLQFLGLRNEEIYFLFEQFPNLSKFHEYKPKFSKKLGLKRKLNVSNISRLYLHLLILVSISRMLQF